MSIGLFWRAILIILFGVFLGRNLFANDLLQEQEEQKIFEINSNPGISLSTKETAGLIELWGSITDELTGTVPRNSTRALSNDKTKLAAFVGATWKFTYTIINTYTTTLVCQNTIQTSSTGQIILLCTADGKDSAGVAPTDDGHIVISVQNTLKEVFYLNPSSNYCSGASGIYMMSAISDKVYSVTANRLSGPTCNSDSSANPTACPTVTINSNLSIHIPQAVYQPASGNPLNLWADLQLVPSSSGLQWGMVNYGVNP